MNSRILYDTNEIYAYYIWKLKNIYYLFIILLCVSYASGHLSIIRFVNTQNIDRIPKKNNIHKNKIEPKKKKN